MTESSSRFLRCCSEKLDFAQIIRQKPAVYLNLAVNRQAFGDAAESYETSMSNPDYLFSLGFRDADLLSVIYSLCENSLRNAILGLPIFVWSRSDLLLALEGYFNKPLREELQLAFDKLSAELQMPAEDMRMKELTTVGNALRAVLDKAAPDNLDWLSGYGTCISKAEQDYCRFWFALPREKLNQIAEHIVHAFFHGFISQSRQQLGRSTVRFVYAIGQEALAQRIVAIFAEHGVKCIIMQPSSSAYSAQYLADHQYDDAINTTQDYYLARQHAYEYATEKYRDDLLDVCGFVRVGSFGKATRTITPSPHAYRPTDSVMAMYSRQKQAMRTMEAALLKPDTLSFCSSTFPDMHLGECMPNVFEEFVRINTEDPTHYELVQKELIDLLDLCSCVFLRGRNGNRTNLQVNLHKLENPALQTNFLNCGGDINVPHGEIFTTPLLNGSNGLLHVKKAYLKDRYYQDLFLEIKDGLVVDFGCANTGDKQLDREYVFENLLQSTERAPIGELAIGTNTLAYKVAKNLRIFDRLPILLVEKMGPHLAVGDPCFARGEDSPVCNIYGGKEMVARSNEMTDMRHVNQDCYVNFHTDITIPYDEIGLFEGLTVDKRKVVIIKNGRFVPQSAALLNQHLEEII